MAAASSPTLFLDVLGVVRRWRRPILLTTLAAAVVSAIAAMLMPNIYPAKTIFYASNLETSDPEQLTSGERRVVMLPKTEDLDRAVNIGNSQPVADELIKRYHLAHHWKMDTVPVPEAHQLILEEFADRLDIQVTDRDAVQLTFLDEDREMAATIANAIVSRIDSISQALTRPNRERVLALFEHKYRLLDQVYTATRDSLEHTRLRAGIIGMDRETRYLARTLTEKQTALQQARAQLASLRSGGQASAALAAEVAGLEAAVDGLQHQKPGSNTLSVDSYHHSHYLVTRLQAELDAIQASLVQARAAYEVARATMSGRVSTVYVVQPAFPVARKVKPIRWLIVLASTLGAFALTTLAALLLEQFRSQTGESLWETEEEPTTATAWPTEKVRS